MDNYNQIRFDRFMIDLKNAELWYESQKLHVLPKDFAVLSQLVRQAGNLVTKEALLGTIWQGVNVSDDVLKTSIKRVRKILRDDHRTPEFIETVHRKGYRFIASTQFTQSQHVVSTNIEKTRADPVIIGRQPALDRLRCHFNKAASGQKQLVFIHGEPGIGKTSLIDVFVSQYILAHGLPSVTGQCIEQYGFGEPYRPVLEGLTGLCSSADGDRWLNILKRYGPMWLNLIPWLCPKEDIEALKSATMGVTPGRMLRELCQIVENGTQKTPLVLIIEDLHWSVWPIISGRYGMSAIRIRLSKQPLKRSPPQDVRRIPLWLPL